MATVNLTPNTAGVGWTKKDDPNNWDTVRANPATSTSTSTSGRVRVERTSSDGFQLYRSFVPIPTSSLSGQTILSAKLKLYVNTETTNQGNAGIGVGLCSQASVNSISTNDHNSRTKKLGSKGSANISTGQYNEFTISNPNDNINKSGYTKFFIQELRDYNYNAPGNSGQINQYEFDAYGGDTNPATLYVEYADKATVTTSSAESVQRLQADVPGNVTDNGGGTVSEKGIAYATSSSPTTSDSKVTSGSGTGSFTAILTGLSYGTTYYARAYAINEAGTAYGSEVNFTTKSSRGMAVFAAIAGF